MTDWLIDETGFLYAICFPKQYNRVKLRYPDIHETGCQHAIGFLNQ